MVICTWFSLTDSQVGHRSWNIARFSCNAVWRCRFWNTFWPLHKWYRSSHIQMESEQIYFQQILGTKWLPLWQIDSFFYYYYYLSETGPRHKKTCFCHTSTTKAQISLRIHAVWSAPLLFEAWIVTRFYNSKLYSSISTYAVSFAESVLSSPVHLFF